MLHIQMLRSSSFKQVKCNWYRMGTIALSVIEIANSKKIEKKRNKWRLIRS